VARFIARAQTCSYIRCMESFVREGGPALWTTAEGDGTPVVFIPGGPGCCDYLEPVARAVPQVRAIRYEPRGCGRSETVDTYRLDDAIADLERLREHHGLDRWVVAGHSAGADWALAYALQHRDRVLGVACLSGGRIHNDRDWHAAYSQARDAGLERDLDYAYPPNMEVNRQLNAEWKVFTKRPGLLRELSELTVPALFVYGSDDIRPSWPIQQVANLLPNARWELLHGAAHNLWLTHERELGRLIAGFVAETSAVR
jgi:proline iminopeptidase